MIYPPPITYSFQQKESLASKYQELDIYILNHRELFELWVSVKRSEGKSGQDILLLLKQGGLKLSVGTLALARDHFSNAKSSVVLVALAKDLARSGNILSQYYTTSQRGKQYIVFKGNQRLRSIITGTRYLADNAKIVKFGVGGTALKSTAKAGFVVSAIFSISLHSIKWLFDGPYQWSNWLTDVSVDILKIAMASIAGYLAAVSAAGLTALAIGSTPVLLPIGVGLAVCVGVAHALDRYDFKKEIKEMAGLLHHYSEKVRTIDETFQDGVYYALSETGKYIRYSVRRFFAHKLNEIKRNLSPQWRF